MKRLNLLCMILAVCMAAKAKTLVVYYSYTNNVNRNVVKSLVLDDVTPLNPDNQITNFIIER